MVFDKRFQAYFAKLAANSSVLTWHSYTDLLLVTISSYFSHTSSSHREVLSETSHDKLQYTLELQDVPCPQWSGREGVGQLEVAKEEEEEDTVWRIFRLAVIYCRESPLKLGLARLD